MMRSLLKPLVFALASLAARFVSFMPGNSAYPVFARHGFHLLRKHYYLPIPDEEDLQFEQVSQLPGITLNDQDFLKRIDQIVLPYKAEFDAFPLEKPAHPSHYHQLNSSFMVADGTIYYSFIRHFKPRRIIEIGVGNSTRLASHAIQRNVAENADHATEFTCIDPFYLSGDETIPGNLKFIRQKVQEVDLHLFESLDANDILFIDSSHVLRSGGDVWWEYCEILPRLKPGVLIHVHDISLPKPYPRFYWQNQLFWNEQYLLQAFLAFNSSFEVFWPGSYMMVKHHQRMLDVFEPGYSAMLKSFPVAEHASFWMQRVK